MNLSDIFNSSNPTLLFYYSGWEAEAAFVTPLKLEFCIYLIYRNNTLMGFEINFSLDHFLAFLMSENQDLTCTNVLEDSTFLCLAISFKDRRQT